MTRSLVILPVLAFGCAELAPALESVLDSAATSQMPEPLPGTAALGYSFDVAEPGVIKGRVVQLTFPEDLKPWTGTQAGYWRPSRSPRAYLVPDGVMLTPDFHHGDLQVSVSDSAEEHHAKLGVTVEASGSYGIGSLSASLSYAEDATSSEHRLFATTTQDIVLYRATLDRSQHQLDPVFERAVASLGEDDDAGWDELFETYGTLVYQSVTVGGRVRATTSRTADASTQSQDFAASVAGNYGTFFAGKASVEAVNEDSQASQLDSTTIDIVGGSAAEGAILLQEGGSTIDWAVTVPADPAVIDSGAAPITHWMPAGRTRERGTRQLHRHLRRRHPVVEMHLQVGADDADLIYGDHAVHNFAVATKRNAVADALLIDLEGLEVSDRFTLTLVDGRLEPEEPLTTYKNFLQSHVDPVTKQLPEGQMMVVVATARHTKQVHGAAVLGSLSLQTLGMTDEVARRSMEAFELYESCRSERVVLVVTENQPDSFAFCEHTAPGHPLLARGPDSVRWTLYDDPAAGHYRVADQPDLTYVTITIEDMEDRWCPGGVEDPDRDFGSTGSTVDVVASIAPSADGFGVDLQMDFTAKEILTGSTPESQQTRLFGTKTVRLWELNENVRSSFRVERIASDSESAFTVTDTTGDEENITRVLPESIAGTLLSRAMVKANKKHNDFAEEDGGKDCWEAGIHSLSFNPLVLGMRRLN